MADAGKNSLWADIESGASTLETDIVGPSYSYADNIPTTDSLGVGSDGTFSQLGTNAEAIGTYVGTLVDSSTPLGNSFFVNTGGTCTSKDGSLQSRYNYVNNVSNSLLGGILGDIEGLDPLYIFHAITADSSPPCDCYQCPTTTGSQYQYLTPELSPDMANSCTPVDPSNCIKESFANKKSDSWIPVAIALVSIFILSCK